MKKSIRSALLLLALAVGSFLLLMAVVVAKVTVFPSKPQQVEEAISRGAKLVNENHDLQTALAEFTAALLLDPHAVEAYRGRYYAYIGLGMHEAALREIESAIRESPNTARLQNDRGSALVGNERRGFNNEVTA